MEGEETGVRNGGRRFVCDSEVEEEDVLSIKDTTRVTGGVQEV